jgi:hypothetical protein
MNEWVEKASQIREYTKLLRVYFTIDHWAKAVVSVMQLKVMIGITLCADERKVLEHAQTHISGIK